ncbi:MULTISPECIES: DUF397 domain-containing protein [unclassified Streptomyces]|uniref:DUF397 domain-containing protein n=1 Tax=unclassified Streptomyces TaxID=2593676 RepID=UPI002E803FAA|nr:DUF397 domain-containing protein [Streptomyces sp. NBC_00523]WUC98916.1 DUF397 domain-containing protein [Streptomyces sp. NBC_00523]
MSEHPARPASRWRSSSYSTGMNNCVETAPSVSGRLLAVRDSKDVGLTHLAFSPTAWTSFVSGLKR